MNQSSKILSDIIVHMKYARYDKKKKRRETWEEIIDRNKKMHIKKYPKLKNEIEAVYALVYDKKILPSMRGLQFGGKAIEKNPVRQLNCSAVSVSYPDVFKEIAFLLMSGTGAGYSVQLHHVEQLPEIYKPKKTRRFLVADSIEGWADAIGALMDAYFGTRKSCPIFDLSDIREQGEPLKTSGGRAPGPEPLKDCLHNIKKILDRKEDREKLSSLEAHDIVCFIADCVVVGGTRRSSCIALFSFTDKEMLECKFGDWYINNPQRGRANNSAVILRHQIKEEEFKEFWKLIEHSKAGEPGIYFSNSTETLCNPCQPGWAKVLTQNGIKKIKDIKVGDKIWSSEGWSKVTKKWCTGEKEVYKYSTLASVFYGTETHKLISNGNKIEAKDCESIDILAGPSSLVSGSHTNTAKQAIMDGLLIGDGTVHKASNNLILLCVGDKDKEYFTSEIKLLIKKHRPGIGPRRYEVHTKLTPTDLPRTYDRKIPPMYLYHHDKSIVCAFLKGLFSANGAVGYKSLMLGATSLQVIEGVQVMLSSIGIRSSYHLRPEKNITFRNGTYKCKPLYALQISADREIFYNCVGFLQHYKMDKLYKELQGEKDKKGKSKQTYDIKSVEFIAVEKVYSLTIDNKSHTYWTQGCNSGNCGEVSLKATGGFCNLVEIATSDLKTQEEYNKRAKAAAFIATLQAGYTDFHYLREKWKENAEKEALIGVGITGIASGGVLDLNMKEAAQIVNKENERVAELIGIKKARRTTVVKPSGTSSLVLGSSSGIHSWHSQYYIRRVRVGKDESIYKYLSIFHSELIEDDYFKPTTQAIISVPISAPDSAITRNETALQLLERVKKVYKNWIVPGHHKGYNTNNVSVTVTIKPNEWERVGKWLWENKESYNAISVLPYDDHTYKQPPFEEITKEVYEKMVKTLKKVDLTKIQEDGDYTNLTGEQACGGGACEIV